MLVLLSLLLVALASDPVFVQPVTEPDPGQSEIVQEAQSLNDNLEKILAHLRQVEPTADEPDEPVVAPTEVIPVDPEPVEAAEPVDPDNLNGYAESTP